MFRPGHSYIEGQYRFTFEEGYEICRVECSDYYKQNMQNFCRGCKEMDFILYHPHKKELWLVEVKDFRFNARPRVKELSEALCCKLRDTLFLLKTAAIKAPHEFPEEGISLRRMARLCENAHRIRVAYTIELGHKGIHPPLHLLVSIKDLVYRHVRKIDSRMLCLPITRSGGVGPWRISRAQGQLSAREHKQREHSQQKYLTKTTTQTTTQTT